MTDKNLPNSETLTIGQTLKAARKAQNLTLEVVSKKLCISERHLKHLEADHENLVCDVYTVGFLRSYAQFLGLDEKELSDQFKEQVSPPHSLHLPFPAPVPGKGIPSFRIIGGSLFILLVTIISWQWHTYSDVPPSPYQKPQEAEPIQVAVSSETPVIQDVSFSETPPPALESAKTIQPLKETPSLNPEPGTVTLRATEDAWVEVRDDQGNILLSRVIKPDESFEFSNPNHLVLKTGNARVTQLVSGEKVLSFSGVDGAVKSNISLNPNKWVAQKPETH